MVPVRFLPLDSCRKWTKLSSAFFVWQKIDGSLFHGTLYIYLGAAKKNDSVETKNRKKRGLVRFTNTVSKVIFESIIAYGRKLQLFVLLTNILMSTDCYCRKAKPILKLIQEVIHYSSSSTLTVDLILNTPLLHYYPQGIPKRLRLDGSYKFTMI